MDIDGRRYGQAQAGGSILLGGALDWDATGIADSARDIAIVVRPGAVLDASGSRLAIDTPRGSRLGTLDLAGDGGQIVLKSSYGLFLDGDMRAGRAARARPAARWRWRWKRPRSCCRSTPRTACAGRAN